MNQFRDIRAVDRVTVTRVRYCVGDGIEGDIVRILTEWWDDEGDLIHVEPDDFPAMPENDPRRRQLMCEKLGHPGYTMDMCVCGKYASRAALARVADEAAAEVVFGGSEDAAEGSLSAVRIKQLRDALQGLLDVVLVPISSSPPIWREPVLRGAIERARQVLADLDS